MDNDGDLDIVVGIGAGLVYYFQNDGTATAPSWTLESDNWLPQDIGTYAVVTVADMDNDDDYDILVGASTGYIFYFQNDGTAASSSFSMESDNWVSYDVGSYAAPKAADMDNDGDFDLIVGEQLGAVFYFQNDGTAASSSFSMESDDWLPNNIGTYPVPTPHDFDGDGDFDLIVGESGAAGGNYFRNDGTAASSSFLLIDQTFFPQGIEYDNRTDFSVADMDGDGYDDIISGGTDGYIYYYQHFGENDYPYWVYETDNFLSGNAEAYARAAFADMDNDGDLDIIAGGSSGLVKYIINNGTAASSSFTYADEANTTDLLGVDVGSNAIPTIGDLDDDGDFDLLVGDTDGIVHYFRNDGTAASSSFTYESDNFLAVDVGSQATPWLVDLDDDDDLDLLVGDSDGYVEYYINQGTTASSSFVHESDNFLPVDVQLRATPVAGDMDADGDYDLMVGNQGYVYYFRNDGTAASSSFTHMDSHVTWNTGITFGIAARISMADIDNDGDLDLFGTDSGITMDYFENSRNYERYASGTITSAIYDATSSPAWGTIDWSSSGGQTITMKVRTDTDSGMAGATAWASCTAVTDGADITANACVTDGDRYVQYQASLSTADTKQTPSLTQNIINYEYYPSTTTLTSSPFDTEGSTNKIMSMTWSETLPANSNVKFQLRTAPDNAGSPGVYSSWMGPDGTSNTYFTDNTGGESIPAALADGSDDQWMQWKTWLFSLTGLNTPTLSDVTMTHQMNNAPVATSSLITGADDPIYAGTEYALTATYTDTDGYANLSKMYLKLDHDSATDIEFYATEGTATGSVVILTGSDYLIGTPTYSYTTTTNNAVVTFTFTPDWDWTESTLIEYGLTAVDDRGATSTYSSTSIDVQYENDLTFNGSLTASSSIQGTIITGDWVQASEIITWEGLTVLYQNSSTSPPEDSFDIRVTDDDTGSWIQTSGVTLNVTSTADSTTDTSDVHNVDIINIPTGGSDDSTETFTVKVDASSPTGVSLAWGDITQTAITVTASGSVDLDSGLPSTPYYIVVDKDASSFTIADANSGWTASTWNLTSLSSGVNHAFRVKSRDAVGNESSWAVPIPSYNNTVSSGTPAPPAVGGGTSSFTKPKATPENPKGEFKIEIENGLDGTTKNIVNIKLFGSNSIKKVAISERKDFKGVSLEDYTETKQFKLSNGYGKKTIYAKFYDSNLNPSDVVYDIIHKTRVKSFIKVCKVITDENNNITTGQDNPGIFEIKGTGIGTVTFKTPLNLNTDIFLADGILDAECRDYPNLIIRSYRYNREKVIGDGYQEPLYNDQLVSSVRTLDDFYQFDLRNLDSNGYINLTLSRGPYRILVVKNRYKIKSSALPFCGDNAVNQDWEECDGEVDCTELCQSILRISPTEEPSEDDIIIIPIIPEIPDIPDEPPIKSPIQSKPPTEEPGKKEPLSEPQEDTDTTPVGVLFFKAFGGIIIEAVEDTVEFIAGQTLKSIFEPTKPAESVNIFIEFKGKDEAWTIVKFVLQDDDGDGIFEGDIGLPMVLGSYTMKTEIVYIDGTRETIRKNILIDPLGYIYEEKDGKESRIPNALVTIYSLNNNSGKFKQWESEQYNQENPQTTDETGQYSFLVPEGRYYINVKVDGYKEYDSEEFDAKEGFVVIKNIKITEKRTALSSITKTIGAVAAVTIEGVEKVFTSPTGKVTTKTVETVGVVTTIGVVISSLLTTPVSLYELLLLPLRLWGLLLIAFGIRIKRKSWGVVYDSETKQPLDPAYVVLKDKDGNEVNTAITDLDGRYGFLSTPGQYTMEANKSHYVFPSKKVKKQDISGLYSNLYFGEKIKVASAGEVIMRNIPMDRQGFDWNEFAKKDKKLMKFHSKVDVFLTSKPMTALFILGFTFSVISTLISFSFYNIFITSFYAVLLLFKRMLLKPKTEGRITDNETGAPLSFSIIEVFSDFKSDKLFQKVSDKLGKYYCLVPPGNYYLKIKKKLPDGYYSEVFSSDKINAKKGIIDKHFKV